MSFVKNNEQIIYYQMTCGHCKTHCGVLSDSITKTIYTHNTKNTTETITEYIWHCPSCLKENVEMFNLPNPKYLSKSKD